MLTREQKQAATDAKILRAFDWAIVPLADSWGGKVLARRLCLWRIYLGPIIVVLMMYGGYTDATWANLVAVPLFMLACITDLLDGPVARAYKAVTPEGKRLDQKADKVLVLPVLVASVVWTGTVHEPVLYNFTFEGMILMAMYFPYASLGCSRLVQDWWSLKLYRLIPDMGSNGEGQKKTHWDMGACFYALCFMTIYHFYSLDAAWVVLIMAPPSAFMLLQSHRYANRSLAQKRQILQQMLASKR